MQKSSEPLMRRFVLAPIESLFSTVPEENGGIRAYLLALGLVACAVLVRFAVAPVSAGVPYVTFFPAVTLAAIVGGYRAGLLSTVLSVVLINFLFIPPYYSFENENFVLSLWSNVVFLFGGVIVSLAIGAMHRYRQRYQHELEESKASEARAIKLNEKLEKQIARRIRTEERLRIAAVAFETHEAIAICDPNGNFIRVNQAFQNITGYSSEAVLGKNPRLLKSGRHDRAFYQAMWNDLLTKGIWSGEVWDKRKSGQIYPKWLTITAVRNRQGEISAFVSIFNDITERKQAEEEIARLAYYDVLTRLPNRRLLLDRLQLALSVSARSGHYGAVLFLDMDRFKMLNDSLGHDYGDQMLIEVARRIESCVREMDSVARLGGDEFVVLLEELDVDESKASQKAAVAAEKIREALAAPYRLNQHEHHSSPSIGICLYRGHEHSVDELLKHADMAMYQAKDAGRNAVQFFDPAMQQAVNARVALEADLRRALQEDQLRLFYQIQTDTAGRITGAEALVRWIHPERGMVSPAQFIPVAEESSLILDIGAWVLETACRQLAEWSMRASTRQLELAVNVSARQFHLQTFVDDVLSTVRRHGIDPGRLKLELTEGVVLADVSDVIVKMETLKVEGVKLSLDDFGTGYSSLSYLKQLPLDQLKIDQSFVRDIATDPSDAAMVKTIIDLGRTFGLNVIAEGVETEEQLDFLKQNGCWAYQGYLFGKPLPIETVEALLQKAAGR